MSTPHATLAAVQAVFAHIGPDRKTQLAGVYADDVVFVDPMHRIEGRVALEQYMDRMARGLRWARFEFDEATISGDSIAVPWTMRFAMKALPGEHALEGITVLRVRDGLVTWHRDYFDVGAMLYEKIPGLGLVIRAIRRSVG